VIQLGDCEISILINGEQLGGFFAMGHVEDLTVGVLIGKVESNVIDGKDER